MINCRLKFTILCSSAPSISHNPIPCSTPLAADVAVAAPNPHRLAAVHRRHHHPRSRAQLLLCPSPAITDLRRPLPRDHPSTAAASSMCAVSLFTAGNPICLCPSAITASLPAVDSKQIAAILRPRRAQISPPRRRLSLPVPASSSAAAPSKFSCPLCGEEEKKTVWERKEEHGSAEGEERIEKKNKSLALKKSARKVSVNLGCTSQQFLIWASKPNCPKAQ